MFNFLHPRPVVDGRAVVVQIVQQKATARQDLRTLIVANRTTVSTQPATDDIDSHVAED